MITDLVAGFSILLYVLAVTVWVAGRRSLQRRREIERSARERQAALRAQAEEKAYLEWLEQTVFSSEGSQP